MKMHRPAPCMRRQRGVATVLVTLVLLLAVGLISLYTSRSAVVEQRISANEVRAKQALAAANAGLDQALAYVRSGDIHRTDVAGDAYIEVDALKPIPLTSGGGTGSSYQVVFRDIRNPLPECPPSAAGTLTPEPPVPAASAPMLGIMVVSCGWSDDSTSVQRVMQQVQRIPPFTASPPTPLVSKGGIKAGGNPAVFNYFNDLTVWSGGPIDKNGAPSVTFIRDTDKYPHPDSSFAFRDIGNGSTAPDGYIQSSEKGNKDLKLGHDLVGGDSTLSDKTPAQFFEMFMGMSPADYRAAVPNHVVDSLSDVADPNGKVIWVDAVGTNSATISSNLGTKDKPVVLVINGNLEVSGNIEINGLVFVMGDVKKLNGNVKVYGGMITSGVFDGGGTPSLVYDPFVLVKARGTGGAASKVPGTWRDW